MEIEVRDGKIFATIDDIEHGLAVQIAMQRQKYDENLENRKGSERSDLEIAIMGMCGEMIAARLFDGKADLTSNFGGHPVADIVLPNGQTVDVKTTYGGGDLNVNCGKKSKQCDYYLLIQQLDQRGFQVVGYAEAYHVFQSPMLGEGKSAYYHVERKYLKAPWPLIRKRFHAE